MIQKQFFGQCTEISSILINDQIVVVKHINKNISINKNIFSDHKNGRVTLFEYNNA